MREAPRGTGALSPTLSPGGEGAKQIEIMRRRERQAANSVSVFPHPQGPQHRLRRAAGTTAPAGGRKLREANDRGG